MYIIKLFLLFFVFCINLNSSTLKLSTDEWYPYTSKESKGFIEEIVQEAFANTQIKNSITYNSFELGYQNTLKNTYQGTFPYFFTKERAENFYYSKALFQVENVLFYNKENFKNDTKNIYKYKIGFVKGYAYKNIDTSKFTNFIELDNELVGFDMLYKGEIDLLPSNKLVGIHLIKQYFNDFYTNLDYIKNNSFISKDTLHLILNKKDPKNRQIIDKFNDSLSKLEKNGKYKKILLNNRNLINANLANVVKLVNNTESFPIVVATQEPNSKEKYMIPRGTKAIVLEWSKHFKEKGIIKVYDEMFKKTKVQIVNGPLKGKILYVENMYIEID